MDGYMGNILRVNLSRKTISKDILREADAKKYLGGRGLAAKILFSELRPRTEALGPENELVYATGPLAATGYPLNSRWLVAAKSPLTGAWGESTCGGTFAVQLRKAGYDALVVEGASENPIYINIFNDEVEIKDAAHLWEKMSLETELQIANDLGIKERKEDNPAVVNIGPAGERLVKFAAIMHTAHRAAARTGLGAVMGSKKLKAIAVRGTKKIPIAKPQDLMKIVRTAAAETVTNPSMKFFTKHGQVGDVDRLQLLGMLPTKNFQQGTFDQYEAISGVTMTQTILKGRNTCSQCAVNCKRVVEVLEGQYAPVDPRYGGPEYENDAALGSNLLISDLKAISKENELCNAYGLDAISTGAVIAWVIECFDRGLLSKADLDGIDATWGNADAALKLIQKIATREGVGNILAEGVKRATEHFGKGSERYALEVKGMEIPMHEPRAKKGLGLSYATSLRGGCHVQSFSDTMLEHPNASPEIGISNPIDRHDTTRNKVEMIKRSQDWAAVTNSFLLCISPGWTGFNYTRPGFLAEALNAVTGWDMKVEELLLAGERMNNLCRCFNAREGLTRRDDYLPPRIMLDPLPDGPSKGQCLTKEQLENMLENYYDIRGWDERTGNPTEGKLTELGLEFARLS
jgi:aldehyde:ferredoxin oxidoreductase